MTEKVDPELARKLVLQLLQEPREPTGKVINDLLSQFYRGFPVVELRQFLVNRDTAVLRAGVWLAAELSTRAAPVFEDIEPLVDHGDSYVRFHVIQSVLACATPANAKSLAGVVSMIDDAHTGVRYMTLRFLAVASIEQLQAALTFLQTDRPQSAHTRELRWLLGEGARDPAEVRERLRSENPTLRRFGAAAAARLPEAVTETLLVAGEAQDEEVKGLAKFHGIRVRSRRLRRTGTPTE